MAKPGQQQDQQIDVNNWALVNANLVVNVIVADPTFIAQIQPQYQFVVNIDLLPPPLPGPGWSYDGVNFTPPLVPNQEVIDSGSNAVQLTPVNTQLRDTAPHSPGDMVFNSDTNKLEIYDGSKWNAAF